MLLNDETRRSPSQLCGNENGMDMSKRKDQLAESYVVVVVCQ